MPAPIRLALGLLAGLAGQAFAQAPVDHDALLRQMRACLAEERLAPPCTMVDRARGFVVIKDRDPSKPDAYLIVPDRPVTGIEDPHALRPPVEDFWAYGWEVAQRLVDRPPEDMALAINSEQGRSQNLLHIHIACVLPAVRDALARGRIGDAWAPGPFVRFRASDYNARSVAGLEPSPFRVLRELPAARADMGAQSLAVIGRADGGFFLLADESAPGDPAAAEELMDESCG